MRDKEYHMQLNQTISELKKEVDPAWAKQRRLEYLNQERLSLLPHIRFLEETYFRANYIERQLTRDRLKNYYAELDRIIMRIRLTENDVIRKGQITPEQISQARDYPIESLIELKRGKARCPFHNDKTPSLSVKNNRLR